MPDWVVAILQSYGLAGVVIFFLGAVIVFMVRRDQAKDEKIAKLYDERGSEREVLVKLVEAGNNATSLATMATTDRNRAIEMLADSIKTWSNEAEKHNAVAEVRDRNMEKRYDDLSAVISSLAESNRVVGAKLIDVNNGQQSLIQSLQQVAIGVSTLNQRHAT